ncbi:MAG: hypothetical protein ACHQ4H_06040 [Ktedonobacterales bacterium]
MAGIAARPPGAGVANPPPAGRPSYAVRPSHVRTLLWLRLKLTLRGYARSWQRVVGLVVALVFLVPLAGGIAFVTAAAYLGLPRPESTQVLFGVVGALYLAWAALPLLQYSLNEGLDVTKLQIYPLTRGEQMISLLLSTLLDVSTIFLLLILGAVLIGWHATPLAAVITVVALALIYVHVVSLSQLMLAALMGLLRTRRFRDITVIVFALFGSLCSIGSQFIARAFFDFGRVDGGAALLTLHLDRYLRWTPPGMAAQAIVLADRGDYALAVPWLAGSLVAAPLLLALWAWVLDRSITNAESAGSGGKRGRGRAGSRAVAARGVAHPRPPGARAGAVAPAARRRWRPVSGVALAIAGKDARYLWRDPQLKAALISVLFATIIILFPNIYASSSRFAADSPGNFDAVTVLIAPLPALLVVLSFSLNALGMERQGLQTLFLFPVRPLDVLFGKNLFVGGFAFAFEVVLTCIRAALTGGWQYVPIALTAGLAALLVLLGCGNVTSVIAPIRWRTMRMGDTSSYSSESGCLRAVISLISMGVAGVLLIPVVVAVGAPLLAGHSGWLPLTLPLALVYGAALYQAATRLIARVLLRRAPEILAVTVSQA